MAADHRKYNHHIFMVAELVRPANSARRRLHELVTCLETVVVYFSASRGVSLVAEIDKVRGQLPEKWLLTTENKITTYSWWLSSYGLANSARRRLHELVTCLETVVIYFSTSKGVSLVAEFDKVRGGGQFPEKVLLTTENHHICMVTTLVRPANSARRRLCCSPRVPRRS